MSLVPVSRQSFSTVPVRLEKLQVLHQLLIDGNLNKDVFKAFASLQEIDQTAICKKIFIQVATHSQAKRKEQMINIVKGEINNLSQDLETIKYRKSFSSQLLDSRSLSSATLPMKIWGGGWPRPIPRLDERPEPYKGQCHKLISTISRTVEETSNGWDYNGLPPYLETIRQMESGKSFTDTYLEASHNEAPATTCVGASRILLKQLKKRHGVEGMLAGMRRHGQRRPFCHAAVIVQCQDGYVLIDPYLASSKRILSLGFNQTIKPNSYTCAAASLPGADIPIQLTYNGEEVLTYHTHLANIDDLVFKNYMMEIVMQPPPPGQYPAFSACVYDYRPKQKKIIKCILISPLASKLIFKDLTVREEGPGRTTEISFQEAVLTDKLSSTLKHFYSTHPTFRIKQEKLYQQLLEFVQKAAIINQTFYGIEE